MSCDQRVIEIGKRRPDGARRKAGGKPPIRGCAETLLDGALEDPAVNRMFVERINAHAIRLSNISADLLALSGLDAGSAPAPMSPVPLRAALETALRAVESEARIRGVDVRCGTLEDIEVLGHRLRLLRLRGHRCCLRPPALAIYAEVC